MCDDRQRHETGSFSPIAVIGGIIIGPTYGGLIGG